MPYKPEFIQDARTFLKLYGPVPDLTSHIAVLRRQIALLEAAQRYLDGFCCRRCWVVLRPEEPVPESWVAIAIDCSTLGEGQEVKSFCCNACWKKNPVALVYCSCCNKMRLVHFPNGIPSGHVFCHGCRGEYDKNHELNQHMEDYEDMRKHAT
jgi:hypothetical protein